MTSYSDTKSAPSVKTPSSQHLREGNLTETDANTHRPLLVMSSQTDVVEPLYLETARDLEDAIRDMMECFEGKETEKNWSDREKSSIKLRRITKGNSPQDFTVTYLACIKTLLDSILKVVNSLRTTVSSNGCLLVQEIAKTAGSGIDNMVEILLQSLVKLCSNTKKITAANGDITVNAVLANITYNARVGHHIWLACQDKNVQPRSYATGWLKTILEKHRHHKSALEHGGSLELIEKCLKAGLGDRDLKVRASMRPTYWAFARIYPERSEAILSGLDSKQQKLLLEEPSNPRPPKDAEASSVATGPPKAHALARSTNSVPSKPSIRETIAAQKRAKMATTPLSERPGSADCTSPQKYSSAMSGIARPATAMSSTMGTLSSAPVRPMRPSRKVERPEPKKGVTAEASTSKRPTRNSPTKTSEDTHSSPSSSKKNGQISSKKPIASPPRKENVIPTTQQHSNPTKAPRDINALKSADASISKERRISTSPPEREPVRGRPTSKSPPTTKARPTWSPPGAVRPSSKSPTTMERRPSISNERRPSVSHEQRLSSTETVITTSPPSKINEKKNSSEKSNPTLKTEEKISQAKTNPQPTTREENCGPSKITSQPTACEERTSPEERISPATVPKKETDNRLKVYEDPTLDPPQSANSSSSVALNVLEELPVNKPHLYLSQLTLQLPLLAEEAEFPSYHGKWIDMETAASRVVMSSEKTANPYVMRRILESALTRLRSNTLDVHGFRKLQALIRDKEDIWDEGVKFDELLELLLENLESPHSVAAGSTPRAKEQVKTQVLMTIRLLQKHQPQLFAGYYSRVLCTVILARKYHNSTSHMVCGLEETAEVVVEKCDPPPCIDAVLDLLRTEPQTPGDGTLFMGLYILAALLHRISTAMRTSSISTPRSKTLPAPLPSSPLSGDQHARLGQLAVSCLGDTNADIRRAVMEFTLELHDSVSEDGGFWRLVSGTNEDQRSLITYYLFRRDRATRV